MINQAFDPEGVVAVAVGVPLSGYLEDTMIELSPMDGEIAKTVVGPQGDTVVSYSANRAYTCTVNLIAGCPADRALRAAAEGRARAPFSLKSNSDQTIATGGTSYVSTVPTVTYGAQHASRTWVITIPQCVVSQIQE